MTNKKEDIDVKLIKHIQEGLPVTKTPYKDIGQALGMSEDEVIQRLKKLLECGKIRRLAASIAHRKIGIDANAMCVWIRGARRLTYPFSIINLMRSIMVSSSIFNSLLNSRNGLDTRGRLDCKR